MTFISGEHYCFDESYDIIFNLSPFTKINLLLEKPTLFRMLNDENGGNICSIVEKTARLKSA